MRLTRSIALIFLGGFALSLVLETVLDAPREIRVLAALVLAALPCLLLLSRYLRKETARHAAAEAAVVFEATRRMAELEETHRSDRILTVGKIAEMAHEIATPLAVMQAHAQMMGAGEVDEVEQRKTAAVMLQQTRRMTQMVRDVLQLAREKTSTRTAVDLATVARQTVSLLLPLAELRRVRLEVVGEGAVNGARATALGEPSRLLQVVTNLTMNAQQAMLDGGTVTLTVGTRQATPPGERAGPTEDYRFIAVRDEGTGIAKKDMPRIFDAFFTTKQSVGGTGLGLAVSFGIASEHGGWIDVESRPGAGSCFTLYLPTDAAA